MSGGSSFRPGFLCLAADGEDVCLSLSSVLSRQVGFGEASAQTYSFLLLFGELSSPRALTSLVLSWRRYSPWSRFRCPCQLAAGLGQFQVLKCHVVEDGVSPS